MIDAGDGDARAVREGNLRRQHGEMLLDPIGAACDKLQCDAGARAFGAHQNDAAVDRIYAQAHAPRPGIDVHHNARGKG